MKKSLFTVLIATIFALGMVFWVGAFTEKEVKNILVDNAQPDLSIELLSYERHFFSAKAITVLTFKSDPMNELSVLVTSTIHHYPHQASISNKIELQDETLAEKARYYFGTDEWLTSHERITLFSKLTGNMTLLAGHYESDTQFLSTQPVTLDYLIDLKKKDGAFNLNWAGLVGGSAEKNINIQSLQFSSEFSALLKERQQFLLTIGEVVMNLNNVSSLLQDVSLSGKSQQGKLAGTIDTSNELIVKRYQPNSEEQHSYLNNRVNLQLTGLDEPTFDSLSQNIHDEQQVQVLLGTLINRGAELRFPEIKSETPWGDLVGDIDLQLDSGASLAAIFKNPYILLDYISGEANLSLPLSLMDQPDLSEALRIAVISGLLVKDRDLLNLNTSFLQGELILNGQAIPLQ